MKRIINFVLISSNKYLIFFVLAAVAKEAENQRDELKKQRMSYLKKTSGLKKELKLLKDQRKELISDKAPPSPTTKGFLDENDKLQVCRMDFSIEKILQS